MALVVKTDLPIQETYETQAQSLGQEDPLEKEMPPTPIFCMENPMDRGAQQNMVHRMAKIGHY